jgi:hypothetical protein
MQSYFQDVFYKECSTYKKCHQQEGNVTYKDMGLRLDTGFIVHSLFIILLITICSGALTSSHSYSLYSTIAISQLHSTVHYNMHWILWICCTTQVLRYRLLTADVPLPGFPNCPHRIATAIFNSLCIQRELCPIITSLDLYPVTASLAL